MSAKVGASVLLSPMFFQFLLKNWTSLGAINSCSVHPRENHSGQPLNFAIPLPVVCSGKQWIRDVVEVRIAYFCIFVPPIHGINGLG